MGLLEEVKGGYVALDTAPLIYFLEKHPTYHPIVKPFFVALDAGDVTAVTSTITLLETLVQPIRQNQTVLVRQYRQTLLKAKNLTIKPITEDIAIEAAQIRANHNFRTPDAIQLALAVANNTSHFLTNDKKLRRFAPLKVLVLDDWV